VSRLGVYKELEGNTAGTADPNRPKRYPRPYDVVLSNKSCREEGERGYVRSYSVYLPK